MTVLDPAPDHKMPTERLLAPIGLTETQEQVYVLLVCAPRLTVDDVVERLGLSSREAREALSALRDDELVAEVDIRPRRYLATPPDIAIPALVLRRQEELQRARLAAVHLSELARTAAAPHENAPEMLELLTGGDTILRRLDQMQRAAEQQVCALVRPPVLNEPVEAAEVPNLARGVSYRAIYDPTAIAVPVTPDVLRTVMRAGEQTRIFPHVPTKMVLVDSKVALIPLVTHDPAAGCLLVRAPTIVDTLQMFFEALWRQSTPLTALSPDATEALPESDEQTNELILLLTAGLKDDAIARRLGVSSRTLDRRLHALMRGLAARTRFQAGWQAALRFHRSLRSDS